jgi:hypothetical protein
MRSPFLPEIFAQSSGLVVFGQVLVLLVLLVDRRDAGRRSGCPGAAVEEPLDGQLLGPAHDVLDHGPDAKSLKYMISLSPFW